MRVVEPIAEGWRWGSPAGKPGDRAFRMGLPNPKDTQPGIRSLSFRWPKHLENMPDQTVPSPTSWQNERGELLRTVWEDIDCLVAGLLSRSSVGH